MPDDPFITGRTTLYNGIKMRSRLEASWAAYLDRLGLAWVYEPMCFANQAGQYLPDFRVSDPAATIYLEVKGRIADPDALRRRMEIVWDSDPDVYLVIVEGPPDSNSHDPLDDEWWQLSRSRQRGLQFQGSDGATIREWEICGPGDPYETIDYELRRQGTDW
jgi:hypothetical protein